MTFPSSISMAFTNSLLSFFLILILSILTLEANSNEISETILLKRIEKITHLHFYFHDIHSGKNPTAVKVAEAKGTSTKTGFGTTYVMDNALTEEQNKTSNIIGRAQGMYAIASHQVEFLMVLTCEFTRGKYNGSSISILGRNPVLNDVREMPIVGGTGIFRLARGYVLVHTVWLDLPTGDAIVEYNAYIMHL